MENRDLNQICIGQFQVQFNFDQMVRLYVHNAFQYVGADGVTTQINNAPSSALLVNTLLGKKTSKVHASEDGTLTLFFENGEQLTFYDNNTAYECYEIRHGNNTIAV